MLIRMGYWKRLLLFSLVFLTKRRFVNCKLLNKTDILNIPYIDTMPPVASYKTETLPMKISLDVSFMKLEDKNSEFLLRCKLIWIVSWQDNRIKDIQDESYYFDDDQIWTPELHTWTNQIEWRMKNHYTDTIVVRKNGQLEATYFEDYESSCIIDKQDIVYCSIMVNCGPIYEYHFKSILECSTEPCIRFSDSLINMSDDGNQWVLNNTSVFSFSKNQAVYFIIKFKRNFDVTFHLTKSSPVILIILILISFLIPVYSKMRLQINALTYLLGVILIIHIQFEFVSLNHDTESQLQLFYSMALIFLTISWMWNSLAGNIWTSCNHSFQPALDSLLGRTLSMKYLIWILPRQVLESTSILMKIIILIDKIVFLSISICLICLLIYVERLEGLWNIKVR